MNRWCGVARAAAALAILIVLAIPPSAYGYGRGIRDDQLPYGPQGADGRGTDYAVDPSDPQSPRFDGSGYFSNAFPTRRVSSAATPFRAYSGVSRPGVINSGTRPYRTTQYYQPGAGTRYPLYYSPATRTYFYYLTPP